MTFTIITNTSALYLPSSVLFILTILYIYIFHLSCLLLDWVLFPPIHFSPQLVWKLHTLKVTISPTMQQNSLLKLSVLKDKLLTFSFHCGLIKYKIINRLIKQKNKDIQNTH